MLRLVFPLLSPFTLGCIIFFLFKCRKFHSFFLNHAKALSTSAWLNSFTFESMVLVTSGGELQLSSLPCSRINCYNNLSTHSLRIYESVLFVTPLLSVLFVTHFLRWQLICVVIPQHHQPILLNRRQIPFLPSCFNDTPLPSVLYTCHFSQHSIHIQYTLFQTHIHALDCFNFPRTSYIPNTGHRALLSTLLYLYLFQVSECSTHFFFSFFFSFSAYFSPIRT